MDKLVINEMVWDNIYLIIRFNIKDIANFSFSFARINEVTEFIEVEFLSIHLLFSIDF